MSSPRSLVWSVHVLAICAVIGVLHFARPVLLPVILSVFLFYALDPLVDWLQRLRVPRGLGAVLVVSLALGGAAGGFVLLWPELDRVVAKVPEGARQLRATLRETRTSGGDASSALRRVREAAQAIDAAAADSAAPAVTPRGTLRVEIADPWRVSDLLWSGGVSAIGLVGQAMSVLLLTIFLLIEDDSFKRKLVHQMETRGDKRVTVEILNDIATQVERFIWVQFITSLGVAVVTGLGLWAFGVDQPAVWGVFAGLMNLVPYFGPIIVTIVLTGVAFLQFGSLTEAALVSGMTLLVTSLEGNLITPKLLSRSASINLVAIFLAITFWSWIWGVAGMLLAVPMLMAVKVTADRIEGFQLLAEFLAE